MNKLLALAVVAAIGTAPLAHAQSTATSAQTSNSNSNASNTGTNASTNTSGASASQSATSASNNQGNTQWNGSASLSSGGAGGSAGSTAGATGGNVSATVNPVTTIQFTSPPTSRVESASVQDMTSRIEQSGKTEQILSGTRTERIEYSGTTTVRNVPSMNAPPLTSSNDTCMGSWSAGVAVAGFGASGGNTYTDEHCKRIKMSRELWNKGMKAASLALDCMDHDAREALELTGFVCPQTTRAQQLAGVRATTSVSSAVVVTPVVAPPDRPALRPVAYAPPGAAAPATQESVAAVPAPANVLETPPVPAVAAATPIPPAVNVTPAAPPAATPAGAETVQPPAPGAPPALAGAAPAGDLAMPISLARAGKAVTESVTVRVLQQPASADDDRAGPEDVLSTGDAQ